MKRAFTLVETMVAISLLTIAIVAPMLLTVQSLASAYYSRDQITAYYLAQEAIEAVHQIRDGQILQIAESSSGGSINIFGSIPIDQDFRIDATQPTSNAISLCSSDPGGVCEPLRTQASTGLYGYGSGWANTNFTRTVHASFVGGGQDELRIVVTISWQTGSYQKRSFTITEDLYRWIQNGSAA